MPTINHSPSQTGGKFFAEDKGYITYEWDSPTVFAILHTVVEEPYRGQGIAKALLDAAVAFARENGYKIRPVCPYVEKVFSRSEEYDGVSTIKR